MNCVVVIPVSLVGEVKNVLPGCPTSILLKNESDDRFRAGLWSRISNTQKALLANLVGAENVIELDGNPYEAFDEVVSGENFTIISTEE